MPEFAVPEIITVHLGAPDQPARNIQVPFSDYIKNVASSEIYPTWPENAIRANILAQITYALNRIYTEWYPARATISTSPIPPGMTRALWKDGTFTTTSAGLWTTSSTTTW